MRPVGKSAAIPVCRKLKLGKEPLPAYREGPWPRVRGGEVAALGEEGGELR